MPNIFQQGALNSTALAVPNLYISIAPPAAVLQGAPSGRLAVVGTAGWGPVNTPIILGGTQDYIANFGPKQPKSSDIGLAVNIAALQGVSDFRAVRVTDGTDVGGVTVVVPNQVQIGTRYTGTSCGGIQVAFSAISPTGYVTISVSSALFANESFTVFMGTSNPLFGPIFTAINDPQKGSKIINMVGNTGIAYNGAGVYTMSPGSDGGVPTTAQFIGVDGSISGSGTGMYALRGQGCQVGLIHGLTDPSSFSTQAAYGLGEGTYMVVCGPSGDYIQSAVTTFAASGARSPAIKYMFGDWLWWNDDTNGLLLAPPQAFAAGILAGLGPQQSSLNKQLYGVAGSQKSGQVANGGTLTYSAAELTALVTGGLDVICNPAPGGAYWACRTGHNSSPNAATQSDTYTRLTNYFALSFAGTMGTYVGASINATLFGDIRATVLGFLSSCLQQGILGTLDGSQPYAVKCDASNNPQARVALGYVQCDVQVQYQGINEKFIVNLQGGASVSITSSAALAA